MTRQKPPAPAATHPDAEAAFRAAYALHRQGRLGEADEGYRALLKRAPGNFAALYHQGVLRAQQGKFNEARRLITDALKRDPDAAEAHNDLGVVLKAMGRVQDAVASYERALALRPGYAAAHSNLGAALAALKRHQDAIAHYEKALAADSKDAVTLFNLGNALAALERGDDAIARYREALALAPDYAEAHNNLGLALKAAERFDEALAHHQRAVALKPDYAEAHYNLGAALAALNRFEEAASAYRRALALRAGHSDAHNNLGIALAALMRHDEAIAHYRKALALAPKDAGVLNNLGLTLAALGRHEEAIAQFRLALKAKPGIADVLNNLGNSLTELKRFEEAIESYAQAVERDPLHGNARSSLIMLKRQLCQWQDLAAAEAALMTAVPASLSPIQPFVLAHVADDPALQFEAARRYVERRRLDRLPALAEGSPYGHPKLRIAYLSGDLREHTVGVSLAEQIERHDRSRFEVHAFSWGRDDRSPLRRRLEGAFDRFADVRTQSDHDIARQIRALEIDIAIDLNGYTEGCRPGILARRPAPIQVNYLGFPGTLGARYVDYIVVDSVVAPAALAPHFAEKLVHMPHCYLPSDTTRLIAESAPGRAQLGLPERGFVFACFNHVPKITPEIFAVWLRLLKSVPDSVLWLRCDYPAAAENLRGEAHAQGVAPERLVLAPRSPLPEHLARHRAADLMLDTLPFNAHSTAIDALWSGLPILTCVGRGFAARVAASVLAAAGLPELVTESLADYEALALHLARDPAGLAALKAKLAAARAEAPLFDMKRFCRDLERAFTAMAVRLRQGRPPQAIDVEKLPG